MSLLTTKVESRARPVPIFRRRRRRRRRRRVILAGRAGSALSRTLAGPIYGSSQSCCCLLSEQHTVTVVTSQQWVAKHPLCTPRAQIQADLVKMLLTLVFQKTPFLKWCPELSLFLASPKITPLVSHKISAFKNSELAISNYLLGMI